MRGARVVAAVMLGSALSLQAGEPPTKPKERAKAAEISPSAHAVLEKAVGAMGGDAALAKVRGMKVSSKGTFKSGAFESPYTAETIFMLPSRVVWKLDSPSFKGSIGVNGGNAWTQFMAPPARAAGAMKESLLEMPLQLQAWLVRPILELRRWPVTGGEPEKLDGKTVYRVQISLPRDRKYTMTFTGEDKPVLTAVEGDTFLWDGRKGRVLMKYSHPKVFGEVTLASSVQQDTLVEGKVEESMKEEIVSVDWNPRPARNAFNMPELGIELMKASVKEVEGSDAVSIVYAGPYDKMGEKIRALQNGVKGTACMPIGPVVTIYLNDPNSVKDPSELRTEIFLPVAVTGAPPDKLPEGMALKKLPGGTMASISARGEYGKADVTALQALFAWITKEGHAVAGPPRMVYYHDPEMTVKEDLVSEVQIPIQKK